MNITIYTKSNCPNCVSAKQLLMAKGLEYTEIESMPEILEMLRHYPDARQMPQIFINGQRVGGFAGLQAALNWPEEALKQVGL
jgi:glutaredoxin 3